MKKKAKVGKLGKKKKTVLKKYAAQVKESIGWWTDDRKLEKEARRERQRAARAEKMQGRKPKKKR